MKISALIFILLFGYIFTYSQCIQQPVYFDLDNSIDTIYLTGRCGNPLDEPDTEFLNPKNFGYIKYGNDFLIDCGFTKNCAREAHLIIQASDTLIKIIKHEIDTGEVTTCEDYERFTFWFPLSSKGYFHININGYDTIVSGLTGINNLAIKHYKVYPNPIVNELNIDVTGNQNTKYIQIFNVSGQLIFNSIFSTETLKVNTSGMKKGYYILQVFDKYMNKVILTEQIVRE